MVVAAACLVLCAWCVAADASSFILVSPLVVIFVIVLSVISVDAKGVMRLAAEVLVGTKGVLFQSVLASGNVCHRGIALLGCFVFFGFVLPGTSSSGFFAFWLPPVSAPICLCSHLSLRKSWG